MAKNSIYKKEESFNKVGCILVDVVLVVKFKTTIFKLP